MNPYAIIIVLLAFMATGWGGFSLGVDHEKANQVDAQALVAEAVDAANASAAQAIAKITVKNQTIRQEVEREIRTNTIYNDCRHTTDGLRLVNEAITGSKAQPADRGELPRSGPAGGPVIRSDDGQAGRSVGPVPPVPGGGP